VPEVQELLPSFRAAHTQVLGVSVDSVYCHANWGRDLGGISFPLLADFEPKGEVGRKFGLYLEKAGIDDRGTVIIDSAGIVRHASSVTPAGKRNIAELAELCAAVDRESTGKVEQIVPPAGLPKETVLYVKSHCGFSRATLLARDNLHLGGTLTVKNVTEDAGARTELVHLTGKDQAPCLIVEGKAMPDSEKIIRHLVEVATDLGS
jgi:hypothetical protein